MPSTCSKLGADSDLMLAGWELSEEDFQLEAGDGVPRDTWLLGSEIFIFSGEFHEGLGKEVFGKNDLLVFQTGVVRICCECSEDCEDHGWEEDGVPLSTFIKLFTSNNEDSLGDSSGWQCQFCARVFKNRNKPDWLAAGSSNHTWF